MIEITDQPFTKKFLYRTGEKETLESVAKKFGVSMQKLKKDNSDIKEAYDGCILYINTNNSRYYIVKPLDTIESIATKLNISQEKLIQNNQITKLFIGQKLEY